MALEGQRKVELPSGNLFNKVETRAIGRLYSQEFICLNLGSTWPQLGEQLKQFKIWKPLLEGRQRPKMDASERKMKVIWELYKYSVN